MKRYCCLFSKLMGESQLPPCKVRDKKGSHDFGTTPNSQTG